MPNQKKPSSIKYRADIDGLRAVAIVPVILFHGGLPFVSGGYVGVDVFFVISGFLITSLLIEDIDAGTFRMSSFWLRRARRILPALILVMAACLVAGWFLTFPADYVRLVQSALAQTLFASNFFFWSETGYFAAPADAQPLLHTWSLAIEEQYYLLFPIILVLLTRYCNPLRFRVILGLALLSLGFSVVGAFDHPEAAFYSLHSRAWELLAGSLLALLSQRIAARSSAAPTTSDHWLGWLGLGAVTVSIIGFDEGTPFPGAAALLPTAGAAAMIWANRHGLTGGGVVLSSAPLVWIGRLSYSLYLWHWPVLVFARMIFYPDLDGPLTAAVLGLSFMLAWLSYAYVETPIRRRRLLQNDRMMAAAVTASLATLIVGSAMIWSKDGVGSRVGDEVNTILEARNWPTEAYACADTMMSPCPLGAETSSDRIDFVLWGDSHAQALLPLIDRLASDNGVAGVYWGTSCPPIFGTARERREDRCTKGNAALADLLDKSAVDLVIVAARWSLYTEGFTDFELDTNESGTRYIADQQGVAGSRETANQIFARHFHPSMAGLTEHAGRVAVVAEVPTHGFDPVDCLAHRPARPDLCITPQGQIRKRQRFIDSQLKAIDNLGRTTIIRPADILCDAEQCPTWIDGVAAYKDDDHLSLKGVMLLTSLFEPMIVDLRDETSGQRMTHRLE